MDRNISSIILGVILVLVTLLLMPLILDANDDILTDEVTGETDTGITTAVGVTTGNVTLDRALLNSAVSNVVSISSNITETPVADNYTSTTRMLFMTSMATNSTRTLTTAYTTTGNLTNLTGLEAIAGIGPMVILLGLFASGGLFTFSGFKGRGTGTKGDIAKLVGTVVAVVVALILFDIIVTQTNSLWTSVGAAEGNVTALQSIVGVIPMIVYVGIIVGVSSVHYLAHRRIRASRKGKR